MEIYYDSDDNDSDSNNKNKEQTNPFTSAVCYSEMRSTFKFKRRSLQESCIFFFQKKKMLSSIKVCDCFFDVTVYCKMTEPPYSEFSNLFMNEEHDRKTSLAIMREETCFIAC